MIMRASKLLLCRWLRQREMDLSLNIQFRSAVCEWLTTRMFPFADSQGTWTCPSFFYCLLLFFFSMDRVVCHLVEDLI